MTLVKHADFGRLATPLKCRSWNCDFCAPDRKAQLLALAASGEPQRFLTLTINPAVGEDPADRLRKLSHAWNVCVKRLRRLYKEREVEYLAVVEETKRHEPHLHILLRSPFIEQRFISHFMAEHIESPIVDIRRVRNQGEVVRYVAKYITKAPKQFNRCKRYWTSRHWELPKLGEIKDYLPEGTWFEVIKRPIELVLWDWACQGWRFRRAADDVIIATPTFLDETIPFITTTGNVLTSRQREAPP